MLPIPLENPLIQNRPAGSRARQSSVDTRRMEMYDEEDDED
jgi:hypothetical protein